MRRTGPTNIITRKLIAALKKAGRENDSRAWMRVSELLEKPRRARPSVNLSKINRYASEGELVVVPGTVTSSGRLTKRLTIAALRFTRQSIVKIREAGGEAISLSEALKRNPRGSRVRIIS